MPDYNVLGPPRTVSWTQTNRFTNVTVSARLCCGGVFEMTDPTLAYLTTRIGPETTINDTIGSNQVAVLSAEATNVVLFSGLTLELGTHYLTLIGGVGGWVAGCMAHLERAEGVTLGPEYELLFDTVYGSPAAEIKPATQHFTVASGTLIYAPERTDGFNTWPEATPQHITVIENTPRTFSLDVSDADGDPLGVHYSTWPTNGTVREEGITWDPDNFYNECFPLTELRYTPAENYVGSDYFDYTIRDWHEASGRMAFVTIEVVPPPLGISVAGGGLRLSWNANCPHYEVETAPSLHGAWQTVQEPRNPEGDQLAVMVNPAEAQRFFRLRRTITP